MVWKIDLTPDARKDLAGMGASEAKRILKFLHQRVRLTENPRDAGKALVGSTLVGLWRYRVGDYRIFCRIEDEKICIIVIKIGHRREVYKQH